MAKRLSHYITFIREVHRTFHTTGAVLPSGQHLAKATMRPFLRRERPSRILEVGPGTGALTQEIVRHLKPGDVFDIVELNDRFVDCLRQRFEVEPAFRQSAGQSTVHHVAFQEFQTSAPYDFILCGLPFNNFPQGLVRDIFRRFDDVLAPQGVLSFFEYLWIRNMKSLVASRLERRRLAGVGCVLGWYLDRYEFRHDKIFINFPPAVVHHLRLGESSDPSERKKTTGAKDIVAA
ncbi:MAG: class I SAM-dependent methyltransferase [Pirellulaceae bacterium]